MQSNRCIDWPVYEEEMKHKNGKGNIGHDRRHVERLWLGNMDAKWG